MQAYCFRFYFLLVTVIFFVKMVSPLQCHDSMLTHLFLQTLNSHRREPLCCTLRNLTDHVLAHQFVLTPVCSGLAMVLPRDQVGSTDIFN